MAPSLQPFALREDRHLLEFLVVDAAQIEAALAQVKGCPFGIHTRV